MTARGRVMGEGGRDFEIFASTAPGIESIAAGELKTLGVKGKQILGGVEFHGDLDRIYQANLWLRTATRVLARLGRFHASTFYELERRARKIRWEDFLPASGPVSVRVTCRKSRLYHSDAVAERVLGAIARVAPASLELGQATSSNDGEDADANDSGNAVPSDDVTERSQSFLVRIVDDECEISADSSGDLLHRRGYRKEVAKAPLRETLAAAMVLASGWKHGEPLLDPMCGSGTIPIEAALIARGIAPGLKRDFQFMKWPSFDRKIWDRAIEHAQTVNGNAEGIRGGDRDAGAIDAAKRNADRAGVAGDIQFSTASLSESMAGVEESGAGTGWILTNPPYGVRVGDTDALRNLYARLGSALRPDNRWRLGVLTADPSLARHTRLSLKSRFSTSNGGIPVSFLVSEKPEAEPHPIDE
ncbi:MAG: class I SAM-dependent RNA methyltransferase [Gemmatimonadaceae bacterium]